MMPKKENILFYSINIFLLFILINLSNANVIVTALGHNTFSCENDILYISLDVNFSEKPTKEYYPFILTLDSPEDLQLKCMLEYQNNKIYCFHSFSNENDYIEEGDLLKFPISFPDIEDIKWDYNTFLNEVFRRVHNAKFGCGKEDKKKNKKGQENNILRKYDIEGEIINIDNELCQPASITLNNYHKYNFDLTVSFTGGDILDNLDNDIYLLQDIWMPLPTEEEEDFEDLESPYAFCSSNNKINKDTISNYKLNCYIPIEIDTIYNNIITINSFFDKVYIKQGDKIEIISLNLKNKKNELYNDLKDDDDEEKEKEIICPTLPLFIIHDKNSIMMGDYNDSNSFTIFLMGTLTNGYYTFKNGTRVELSQTYKDIKFHLIIKDNFINSEENDVIIQCVLPEGTPYDEEDEAVVKCTGKKTNRNNVDIELNWNLKDNNNFNSIIIKWPKTYDAKKKNLYGYDVNGVSIKQSDYVCRDNNFDFYVYIYDLGREPKLNFDLPLHYPKNMMAMCKLFDQTTLKCSLNLKHKRISKGTKIMLPEKGIINAIETIEGNKVNFLTNNFTQINNEHDIYIITKESCGDYLLVGTFKDMGMSHKTSVVFYIIFLIIAFILAFGLSAYICYKCKLNYDRGTRLTLLEESKNSTIGNNKK